MLDLLRRAAFAGLGRPVADREAATALTQRPDHLLPRPWLSGVEKRTPSTTLRDGTSDQRIRVRSLSSDRIAEGTVVCESVVQLTLWTVACVPPPQVRNPAAVIEGGRMHPQSRSQGMTAEINALEDPRAQPAGGSNQASPAREQARAHGQAGTDTVNLTEAARQLSRLEHRIMEQPAIDGQRVGQAREAIADCSYAIDVGRVASKLLQFEACLNAR